MSQQEKEGQVVKTPGLSLLTADGTPAAAVLEEGAQTAVAAPPVVAESETPPEAKTDAETPEIQGEELNADLPEQLIAFQERLNKNGVSYGRLAVFWPSPTELMVGEVVAKSVKFNDQLAGRCVEMVRVSAVEKVYIPTPRGMGKEILIGALPFTEGCSIQVCASMAQWLKKLPISQQVEILRMLFYAAEQMKLQAARASGLHIPGPSGAPN